ncbi:hypothetical protein LEQ06_07125 [Paraclostridium sp. AKS46]|nr:hypothetical protein [Paraclostridium sp. AKS46]
MKFIKYPITVQYGKFTLSIYEELDCSIEIIKNYIEFQNIDNKKLDSEVMEYLILKDSNVNIIYNEHNRFNQNLKNIFIELNIEEIIKEIEKSSIENFIHSIFNITNKFNIDTIVDIRKLDDSKSNQKYYKSNLYIRLKQSREFKLNINKNQKLMNIKLFLKSNQDLILNITDPSNFKFKDISLNSKLKKN